MGLAKIASVYNLLNHLRDIGPIGLFKKKLLLLILYCPSLGYYYDARDLIQCISFKAFAVNTMG